MQRINKLLIQDEGVGVLSAEELAERAAREEFERVVSKAKSAQQKYSHFSQAQVDEIFHKAALAASAARIELAKLAVEETGMGIVEDKVIKNHFASEFIYNKYKDEKTCGTIFKDVSFGIRKVAEPIGVIAGIVPTTNPTSTAIFKALIALKTRNGIVFSPHPRAKKSTARAVQIVHDAAVAAGAPEGIVGCIENPTVKLSSALMSHEDISLILATGGPGMVHAAYSSGKPAIGVGAGNTPAIIDETADYKLAVSSILLSKTFDNGVICASEQSVIIVDEVYEKVCQEFEDRGAVFVRGDDIDKLRAVISINGQLNAKIVGQSAYQIAKIAGFEVPENTKVLLAEANEIGVHEALSMEKLSPILAIYRAFDFENAVYLAEKLVTFGGIGHTSVLYTDARNSDRIRLFGDSVSTGRLLLNSPSSQGAIGDVFNFMLEPSLTLGCGSWGGNSVSDNIGVKHLLNVKTIAERRENMLWFKVPPKIYFKYGCLAQAMDDLKGKSRALIVTDNGLFKLGLCDVITTELERLRIDYEIFHDVKPDPDISSIKEGLKVMEIYNPDVIIAFGGGSPMDAAKIMWLMYEHPEVSFDGLAMRFMDIRKRIYRFPDQEGSKSILVAIPTTSGTGSEVTPFAVVTDDATGQKYPVADYALTPTMAIIDSELCMGMPKNLTAASGIDAITHCLEALVSALATEYTDGIALEALRILFEWLPKAYEDGDNIEAREAVHHAATMAGMAFANAFLGVCHSMAHKLGAKYHLIHGEANAMLIAQVIRYNATDKPTKLATFSQYAYPSAKATYARIADYLGLGGSTVDEKVDNLIEAVQSLKRQLGIPMSIEAKGTISKEDFFAHLDEIAEEAFDDQCTTANPRYPLISEIKELLIQGWYGKV